jgi:hypothetical protein
VDWYHGVLQPDTLSRVRFIDYSYWNELSGGSRRPVDVLPTLRSGRLLTAIFVGGLQRRLIVRAYVGVSATIEQWGCF